MTIYGIGVTPEINILIDILLNEYSVNVNVMAYTDDFSATENLKDLKSWSEIRLLSQTNKDLF